MASIDFSDIMKHKTDYLSVAEIERMLNYCYRKGMIRDYMLILTLSRTGRRISEIVGNRPFTHNKGLRPCDIQDSGLIEFDILKKRPIKSKTKSGGEIKPELLIRRRLAKKPKRVLKPVDEWYLDKLRLYIEQKNIPSHLRVFNISRQRADQIIKEIAKECNISRDKMKIHAHQFRHSFAINFLKANPNVPSALIKIKTLLEHSSINVTETYTQFTPGDIKESLEKVFMEGN